ncbi:MAG: ribosome biogenesis GTPase YlqF [Lachnospiraceae bacterium]|nr:ribosome biogenesis GTPase YlqF [Lachnospiraceae bacterium]
MNYQWYPGHMTKAKRMMQEDIKLIDLVIELVDARIPLSSRNPDIDELGKNKSRIILLNKSDLADPAGNAAWTTYFKNKGFHVLEINARSGAGIKSINGLVQQACKEKIERDKRRGLINRPVRAMVVGIPNVGKSTFINSFAGKACTKTGNKPGVTKGKQWIRMKNSLELLDTPGILWPKFEDQEVGMKLAFIGSMNDEIVIIQELALDLIKYIAVRYPGVFEERYGIPYPVDLPEDKAPVEVLTQIAEVRKCYLKGKEPDYDRAASLLVEDFRSGRLGRITLERPEGQSDEE